MALRRPRVLAALMAAGTCALFAPASAHTLPGGLGVNDQRALTTASPGPPPARFAVRGAPLARKGRVVAGRTLSVYARPPAVVVDGCRSRGARVRVRGGRGSIAVTARCRGIRGGLRIRARLRGKTLQGTSNRRSFTARLRPPPGKLLRGRASARASRAIRTVDAVQRHSASEVSTSARGAGFVRTELVLRLKPTATVGQVNGALRAAGGRIAASVPGMPRLVISIPDPGSLGVLDALLARLGRRPGIASALRAGVASTQELPPGFAAPPAGTHAAELSHLLAMRAPAAWNARAAIRLPDRPILVIADKFGNGSFTAHVNAQVDQSAFFTGLPNFHGYHVAGIAAGTFANNGSRAGRVTGVFPARARMTVVDASGVNSLDAAAALLLQAIRAAPGRVVVNASMGHNPNTDDASARQEGSDWATAIRAANATDRLFHAGSAGNDAVPATRNSHWASAALRSDLTNAAGDPVQPLTQTLAVENLVDGGPPAFEPRCLGISSNRGGHIAAVGTNVFSLKLGNAAGNDSGTSQASPQVAGLAEYIWSIAPDLTATQVAAAITSTAAPSLGSGPPCNTDLPSAPRLDAYAAILSLDQPTPVTPGSAPVRLAILDRNGDGIFTHTDIAAFVAGLPAAASVRTWARSDLNGDGFAGGPATGALDLNLSGSARGGAPLLGSVTQVIEGVSVAFNENAVTDMQALCFYAYSGLYSGTAEGRRSALRADTDCGAALQNLSGNFEGVARDCDTNTDGSPSCGEDGETFGLLQVTATGFTFYVQAEDSSIDPATCAVPGQDPNNCFKATGSSTSSPFIGTAISRFEQNPMPFQATLTGNDLRGRIDTDTNPSDPIWIEFELTRVP